MSDTKEKTTKNTKKANNKTNTGFKKKVKRFFIKIGRLFVPAHVVWQKWRDNWNESGKIILYTLITAAILLLVDTGAGYLMKLITQ